MVTDEGDQSLEGREPSLRTIAMPADANWLGDIFGGWVLSQMDIGGALLAKEVARIQAEIGDAVPVDQRP